jgi:hypothetical protein
VIGILIALQINNWNESRKQSIAEKEFITSLKNDLKQDKTLIERIIKHNEPRKEAYEILNRKLLNLYNNDRKSLDSLFKIYFRIQRLFANFRLRSKESCGFSGNETIT